MVARRGLFAPGGFFLYSHTMATRRKTKRSRAIRRSRRTPVATLRIESHVQREIWAVTYMALCILTVLSINGKLGIVGVFWNNFLTPIFGWGIYAVPVLLGGISLALFFARRVMFDFTRIVGITLLVVSTLGTIHLSVPEESLYEVAKAGEYGGYIGFVSSFLARQVLGVMGAYVVFFALFIIAVLMTFSVSLTQILSLFEIRRPVSAKPSRSVSRANQEDDEEDMDEEAVSEDNMVIHNLASSFASRLGQEEDDEEAEILNLRPVRPGDLEEDEAIEVVQPKASQVDESAEDEGEKIPVERIAEALEAAESQAEAEPTKPWEFPSLDLLSDRVMNIELDQNALKEKAETIRDKLGQFDIPVKMHDVHVGPTVIQYTLKPHEGVKLSKITGLKNDLALALAAKAIRIEAPIPGKALVGIEVPNDSRVSVHLRELLESELYLAAAKKNTSKLLIPFGRDVSGKPMVEDLATMPHMLVAGSTGSGKSVFTNAVLLSFLYQNSPRDLRLILVDPKRVELTPYNGIPHLLTPVITESDKAAIALRWVVSEMTRRYTVCADAGHRNIDEYNNDPTSAQHMPRIVVVIDELADLMMVAGKEVEASICRIAQMARAVGIHLIVATQRPSVDVITGLIKANIPARVAFTVASSIDSRTILDGIGAEDLLGRGDMLYLSGTMGKPTRIQGVFVSTEEVQRVTNRVKLTLEDEPMYNDEIVSRQTASIKVPGVPNSSIASGDGDDDDALYDQALEVVKRTQKASATLLQRHLKIGYSRAARLIDLMEERGVVGPGQGAKPREVYVTSDE